MNFLAHLYLSRHSDELMIGNFIADAWKGSNFDGLSAGVVKGIRMHRAIDSYTDQHPVFLQSVKRLRPGYRKYAGVIVDIFYDHFLARNWADYESDNLDVFTARTHQLLRQNSASFPLRSQQFLRYMLTHRIPLPYAEVEGIAAVLRGMAWRARFESGMEHAVNELVQHTKEFEEEFRIFFPQIITYIKEWEAAN